MWGKVRVQPATCTIAFSCRVKCVDVTRTAFSPLLTACPGTRHLINDYIANDYCAHSQTAITIPKSLGYGVQNKLKPLKVKCEASHFSSFHIG